MVLDLFVRAVLVEAMPASGTIFRDNLKRMAKLAGDAYRYEARHPSEDDIFWSDVLLHPEQDKKLMRDISRARALHTNRVVKLLGAGIEGIAFRLDDGSVIKLGQVHSGLTVSSDGKLEPESPVPWKYLPKMRRAEGGTSTQQDVRVTDAGRAHTQMEELQPFDDWIIGRPDSKKLFHANLKLQVTFSRAREKQLPHRRVADLVLKAAQDLVDDEGIDPIILDIAQAFANEAANPSLDLHTGNLGVRMDPGPTFVFYDF